MLCRVAAVKHIPVHHHSADYIFSGPLGLLGSFRVSLKIESRFFDVFLASSDLHSELVLELHLKDFSCLQSNMRLSLLMRLPVLHQKVHRGIWSVGILMPKGN